MPPSDLPVIATLRSVLGLDPVHHGKPILEVVVATRTTRTSIALGEGGTTGRTIAQTQAVCDMLYTAQRSRVPPRTCVDIARRRPRVYRGSSGADEREWLGGHPVHSRGRRNQGAPNGMRAFSYGS